jgi:competence protein ComEA
MPRPLVIAALIAVAAGAVVVVVRARTPAPIPIEVVEATPEPTPPPLIVVDVEGAVTRPGVVRLSSGARVADALAAVGGATPDADPAALNKAATLRDGSRVYVPRYGETPPAGSLGSESERKVDINHATAAELESLPGIGPSTAGRIVRARDQKAFTKIEELQTRGLVGARVFADIRDLVTTR